MNTKITGFKLFPKNLCILVLVLWKKVDLALNGLRLSSLAFFVEIEVCDTPPRQTGEP